MAKAKAKPKRKMGRPKWEPTDEVRSIVKGMALAGIQRELIARVLKVNLKTLRERCREELEDSSNMALGQVAAALYREALDGSVPAMIFIMKCRARWSEPRPESPDDKQVNITITNAVDKPRDESREEWLARREREEASKNEQNDKE